jgi:hypothetical protein
MTQKSIVFWKKFTDFSEEYTASAFRVQKKAKQVERTKQSSACSLPGLLFNPEEGGSTFLQNEFKILLDVTASNSKRYYCS